MCCSRPVVDILVHFFVMLALLLSDPGFERTTVFLLISTISVCFEDLIDFEMSFVRQSVARLRSHWFMNR